MSVGIYLYNGNLAYSINLEKKLKRRKGAVIIEIYEGNAEGPELESILQKMLDKHNNITKTESVSEDKPLSYHWLNKVTKHSFHSIKDKLHSVKDPENWIPYREEHILGRGTAYLFNEILPYKVGDKIVGKTINRIEIFGNNCALFVK